MGNNHSKSEIAGGVRPMAARWIITGEIVLKTAAHFGGEGDSAVDMGVLRDPKDCVPLLPGTSLAGALRSHLADVLGGYRSKEDSGIAALFGGERRKDEGAQSPLIVFDALGWLPDGMPVEIRDGVAIDPATGTAKAHKKFDMEVLPAGTIFPVRVELIIADTVFESRLINLLIMALEGLAKGDISLGMRRSRGLGAVTARNWQAVRHGLTTREGWLGWLTSDTQNPIGDEIETQDSPWKACRTAWPSITREEIEDKRKRVVIDAELSFPGGILVRSPAATPDAPDAVHLVSGGNSILPGTSLAGVLRNCALKIARIISIGKDDAECRVNRIFGPPSGDQEAPQVEHAASRLRVTESVVTNGTRMRPSRIRIDRFTQGVVKSALFDEEPDYGGKATVHLELRDPTSGDTGLLLLLLKDLLSGDLHAGGSGSVGRGVVWGAARIRFSDGQEFSIASDLAVVEEAGALFNSYISAFRGAGPLEQKEEYHEPA